jgi:hypothetical protein
MKHLKRIGVHSLFLSATLASSGPHDDGPRAARADDPPPAVADAAARRQAALARQQAKKQQVQAARAKLQAQRNLESQAEARAEVLLAAGLNPWSSAFSPMGWGSNWSAASGFPGTTAAYGASSMAGGTTTAASGSTSGSRNVNGSGTTNTTAPDGLTFNAKILQFALNHLGQQVGNGQCWTLAADALIDAGAKPADGYVFGDQIPLSSAQAGDILQFESAVFVGATYWMRLGLPHHTAIVDSVQGTQFVILQQNFNGILRVQESPLNMADLKSGTVTVYRAVANDITGRD